MISYREITERIKNNNGLVTALNVLDKAITYITVLVYLIFLIHGFLQIPEDKGLLLYRSILIPGVSFIIVSVYRKLLSAPRPYEVYGFTPALKKDTKGKSFPSRHVFSIFIVAFTVFQAFPVAGAVICVLGFLLAIIRVVGGVHFIKDVVAGFFMALIISIVCYGIFCGVFGLVMLPF
ncbi:MAG: phosphatase PAP2 family protein [Pseudobutyrivibrio ruminis]|uniref:Phosphatase PAP2 family protein n=1 Tax=Pseudobutyrivibrio ruminis TaxID=46206 RepID=A0A927UCM5_9FIRM|nr:phosphatase PAP2 family protein [Pseudobutyrivibrio ruminis]